MNEQKILMGGREGGGGGGQIGNRCACKSTQLHTICVEQRGARIFQGETVNAPPQKKPLTCFDFVLVKSKSPQRNLLRMEKVESEKEVKRNEEKRMMTN